LLQEKASSDICIGFVTDLDSTINDLGSLIEVRLEGKGTHWLTHDCLERIG
jgi:hypothetical protein